MRNNWMLPLQIMLAICAGALALYAQKRVGGPVGGMIPGVLGFLIGWLVTGAILDEIKRLRPWVFRRHFRNLQPKQ